MNWSKCLWFKYMEFHPWVDLWHSYGHVRWHFLSYLLKRVWKKIFLLCIYVELYVECRIYVEEELLTVFIFAASVESIHSWNQTYNIVVLESQCYPPCISAKNTIISAFEKTALLHELGLLLTKIFTCMIFVFGLSQTHHPGTWLIYISTFLASFLKDYSLLQRDQSQGLGSPKRCICLNYNWTFIFNDGMN